MNTLKDIILEYDLPAFDDLDNAIIGFTEINNKYKLVYDIELCVSEIMDLYKLKYIDAQEYFTYNIKDSYIGDNTPILIHKTNSL